MLQLQKMHFYEVIFLMTIGFAIVSPSIIPNAIEVSSSNISNYSIIIDKIGNKTKSICKAGTYLIAADNDVCSPCPSGQFISSESHRLTHCAPCFTPRPSLGEVEIEKCNATQDTVVGCAANYFLHGNRCTHCRHCLYNESDSVCALSCCGARLNVTTEAPGDTTLYECARWSRGPDSGSNDWRIVFIVGLVAISLFSFFICIWRGVIKSGNRGGKIGCLRYKRVRTMSNSM